MAVVNKEYKDRLFSYLFGSEENKAWTLSLYNTINDSHFTDVNAISITTIKEVLYLGMHNDVSFLISDEMNLYEQQSAWNPNMPLRKLQYAGSLFEKYIREHNLNKFGTRLLRLPAPKLVTFYNGSKDLPDETFLYLSDSFPENSVPDIDVRVRMININYGKNETLLSKCEPLREYSWFIHEVRKNAGSVPLDAAIHHAIDSMKEECVIKKYLAAHRAEVIGMLLTEYDEVKTMELFKEAGRREGIEEGIEKGIEEGTLRTLLSLARDRLISIEEGARRSGMTIESFRGLMNL